MVSKTSFLASLYTPLPKEINHPYYDETKANK